MKHQNFYITDWLSPYSLLTGRCVLHILICVLFRIRQQPYIVSTDIEGMFRWSAYNHRILNDFVFLWREDIAPEIASKWRIHRSKQSKSLLGKRCGVRGGAVTMFCCWALLLFAFAICIVFKLVTLVDFFLKTIYFTLMTFFNVFFSETPVSDFIDFFIKKTKKQKLETINWQFGVAVIQTLKLLLNLRGIMFKLAVNSRLYSLM